MRADHPVRKHTWSRQFGFAALASICALALAACASSPTKPDPHSDMALYRAAAGAPVESFDFWRLDSWQHLDDEHLVVWTKPHEAWLLTIWPGCRRMDTANTIALTSSTHRVYARFDKVLVGRHEQCPISEIRPVDLAAYKRARADMRAARQSAQSSGT